MKFQLKLSVGFIKKARCFAATSCPFRSFGGILEVFSVEIMASLHLIEGAAVGQ